MSEIYGDKNISFKSRTTDQGKFANKAHRILLNDFNLNEIKTPKEEKEVFDLGVKYFELGKYKKAKIYFDKILGTSNYYMKSRLIEYMILADI